MKKIVKITAGALWALPFMVMAQDLGYIQRFFTQGKDLLDKVVVFLVALAIAWFIWNVIRYTIAEDEEKKGDAKKQMIWGIVAIAVIVSIWGLVSILQNIFGVDRYQDNNVQLLPNVY